MLLKKKTVLSPSTTCLITNEPTWGLINHSDVRSGSWSHRPEVLQVKTEGTGNNVLNVRRGFNGVLHVIFVEGENLKKEVKSK
jgi:hypothetical protein